ncbi:MAG TPA: alpha/beta hydrolase [Flavipsychrobacter sp.]|nr:alpha/beta hydrolase [Flavipsychrobacter sp.]
MHRYSNHLIDSNNIRLHYIEYPKENVPTIICMHGITANCQAFGGLVAKGLSEYYRLISVDLRGRGLSSQPAFHYSMEDHAADIIGLLDHLRIEKAILMGHSFGGLLSFFLAANYPDRVEKLILLDAAAEMNPDVIEMLGAAFSRLDKKFPSWDAYISEIKAAPYLTFWSDAMESYYKADVMDTDEGGVTPRPNLANIIQCSLGVANEAWNVLIPKIEQPAILVNGLDVYTLGQPLLPDYKAQETVAMMRDCKYIAVDGNHQTMLYEDGAEQIVKAIRNFII